MNKLEEFIQNTQSLRNEIVMLIEQYNQEGKDCFGENWVSTSAHDSIRVMIDVDELLEFEPDPAPTVNGNNALGYSFSSDYVDFFEGKTMGVRVVEIMPFGCSPVSPRDRRYV